MKERLTVITRANENLNTPPVARQESSKPSGQPLVNELNFIRDEYEYAMMLAIIPITKSKKEQ